MNHISLKKTTLYKVTHCATRVYCTSKISKLNGYYTFKLGGRLGTKLLCSDYCPPC